MLAFCGIGEVPGFARRNDAEQRFQTGLGEFSCHGPGAESRPRRDHRFMAAQFTLGTRRAEAGAFAGRDRRPTGAVPVEPFHAGCPACGPEGGLPSEPLGQHDPALRSPGPRDRPGRRPLYLGHGTREPSVHRRSMAGGGYRYQCNRHGATDWHAGAGLPGGTFLRGDPALVLLGNTGLRSGDGAHPGCGRCVLACRCRAFGCRRALGYPGGAG